MIRRITIRLDELKNDRFEVTPEGFLICRAIVTRAGIFDYYDENGKLIRELRPPEEVFAAESLASLRMIPLTFLHPEEKKVDAENIKRLTVGVTGENIEHDDEFVSCMVKIMDKVVVEYVLLRHRQGKDVELSLGYDAEVASTSGQYPREGHYDAVQRNIRYNHLSIVPRGRAGENVKLKLDAKEKTTMFTFIRKQLKLDGFSMDAVEAQVPAEAKGILDRLSAKLDEAVEVIRDRAAKVLDLTKKNDELQGRVDTLEESVKQLKADNEALSDPAGEKIQTIIADRKDLETTAGKLDIKTDGLSDQALKVAVIQKQSPDFKADGRSDDYINARFDSVVELLDAAKKDGANAGLARVIQDARQAGTETKVDHRAEFSKKSATFCD